MRVLASLIAATITLAALPAFAQATAEGTPTRIRGTVERLDGRALAVKSREGASITVTLAEKATINAVVKSDLAAIKPGDFIGSAAVKGTDGKLHAQEVLIFPEAARGTGEGHYPWDLTPGSTMTNATVAEVAAAPRGRTLKLKYKGGETEIEVPLDAPVVTFVPADASLLKPGTAVFVPALKKPDGSIVAGRVLAGKDGVVPPM